MYYRGTYRSVSTEDDSDDTICQSIALILPILCQSIPILNQYQSWANILIHYQFVNSMPILVHQIKPKRSIHWKILDQAKITSVTNLTMQCQSKTKLPILLPIFCQPITNLQCNANSDQTAQFLANRSIHHQSSTDPLPIYLWPVNSMTIKLATDWQSRISKFNPSVNLFPILCQSYNWNSQSSANHFATLDNMQYRSAKSLL